MRTRLVVVMLVLVSVGIPGCAAGAGAPEPGTPGATAPGTPTDPFGCGIVLTPATAVIGAELVISRAASAPAPSASGPDESAPSEPGACATLAPGSTQTLELRATSYGREAEHAVTTVVGDDGAFEARMSVPTGIRLGVAEITAIPPAELDCRGPTADPVADDACVLPRASVTVIFDPQNLALVKIESTEAPTPELPLTDSGQESFAVPGPGVGELTLVIYGSSCEARPVDYVRTAPPDRLDIVSAEIVPPGEDCDAMAVPWTTVIAVPDGFGDYETVTVDNVGAMMLPE